MRIHLQGFIVKHGQNTGRVNKQQTGMAEARHRAIRRVSVGRRSANNIQRARQRDNPGERAIIQARYKQSPKGKAERIIQAHWQESNTGKTIKRLGKTMTNKWAP